MSDEPQFGTDGEEAPPEEQLRPPAPLPSSGLELPGPSPGPESEPQSEQAPGPGSFTSGEKIRSLLDVFLTSPPPDASTRAAVSAIKTAHRFKLLRPVLDVFPPLEAPEAWDEWLALFVGVALNVVSDGVELDVDELRRAGAEVLARLFEDVGGDAGA